MGAPNDRGATSRFPPLQRAQIVALACLERLAAWGYPVVVGASRKRFLGHATGQPVDDRDRATAVACALAWERGARLFRVHDAALTREALRVASATTSCP